MISFPQDDKIVSRLKGHGRHADMWIHDLGICRDMKKHDHLGKDIWERSRKLVDYDRGEPLGELMVERETGHFVLE